MSRHTKCRQELVEGDTALVSHCRVILISLLRFLLKTVKYSFAYVLTHRHAFFGSSNTDFLLNSGIDFCSYRLLIAHTRLIDVVKYNSLPIRRCIKCEITKVNFITLAQEVCDVR